MQHLKLYEIKKEYIHYLHTYQSHLFYDNGSRKYIGILLEIHGVKYFAPLSSFKPKHRQMNEGPVTKSAKRLCLSTTTNCEIKTLLPMPNEQMTLYC